MRPADEGARSSPRLPTMSTRVIDAEMVSDPGADHGEAPLWHPIDKRLDWVDITAGRLHRFDPSTGTDAVIEVGSRLGSFAPRRRGGWVLAVEAGFALIDPGGGIRIVAPVDHRLGQPTRMNDGKCDPFGRFWAGSMAYACTPGHGALYRLDPDLSVTKVIEGVTISNGLDWSDDGRTMFFIDTLAGASFWDVFSGEAVPGIDAFASDPATGAVSERRRLFDIPVKHGVPAGMTIPDGMTIDADGFFWIAVPGDGEVRRYSPRGDIDAVVRVPVACPTSIAFGGEDLDDLYITTMTPHGEPGSDPRHPTPMWPPKKYEGALFRCRPGPTGRRSNTFAG